MDRGANHTILLILNVEHADQRIVVIRQPNPNKFNMNSNKLDK
jgi:hypothetical protein